MHCKKAHHVFSKNTQGNAAFLELDNKIKAFSWVIKTSQNCLDDNVDLTMKVLDGYFLTIDAAVLQQGACLKLMKILHAMFSAYYRIIK